ncbi:DUF3566 domain-containing protein [Nocardioides sp. SYSU D00038]|uniref:DUF3566 domain-containing protein n=1 Tax=Nocardioides sp. SYSU D00038 TaxID=2812554 RepID=UPI0019684509|nr:DUF3566 domain-containing protein [Nocardioides sp. SYSU D00038]
MAERQDRTSATPPPGRGREDTVIRPASGRPANRPQGQAPTKPAPTKPPAKAPVKPAKGKPSRPPQGKGGQPKGGHPPQGKGGQPPQGKGARPQRPQGSGKDDGGIAPRPGRRARLRLSRVDPWSVMKTSFLLSIAFGIVTVVSVLMVWSVLGAAGVWTSVNQTVQDVIGGQETADFDVRDYLGTSRVVGFTMIVAAVDVVLLTAAATLSAFLYNMAASLLGGVEMTLAEDQ